MAFGSVLRQVPAGVILGLSSAIYAVSHGALLYSGPFTPYVGFGISAALIGTCVGLLSGYFAEEPNFVGGSDTNVVSALGITLMTTVAVAQSRQLHLTMVLIFMSSAMTSILFLVVGRFRLGRFVRFVPVPVAAAFLASTGWSMSSGALNIISGAPLTMAGLENVLAQPDRPEIVAGLLVAACLGFMARRMSTALIIPILTAACAIAAYFVLNSDWCVSSYCQSDRWLFPTLGTLPLHAPWELRLDQEDMFLLIAAIPTAFVTSFVALLTMLISTSGLEREFGREYNLDSANFIHGAGGLVATLAGGIVPILSTSRTALQKSLGGTHAALAIAALFCIAVLLGGGPVLSLLPRAALGGLILYLGFLMLKRWLWDQWRQTTTAEFLQTVSIFLIIMQFGYVIGFIVGVLFACFSFVVAFGSTSPARLSTVVADLPSRVVRSTRESERLSAEGPRIPVHRLQGHLFFGSAMKLEELFAGLNATIHTGLLLDFTRVAAIDPSAIETLRRVLRRHRASPLVFFLVHGDKHITAIKAIASVLDDKAEARLFASFDAALEAAEDLILWQTKAAQLTLAAEDSGAAFQSYCTTIFLQKGDALCREGESSKSVFFIRAGAFDVVKHKGDGTEMRLAKIRAGSMAGEMAQYGGGPRSATIRATETGEVSVLDEAGIARMRTKDPELAGRLDLLVIMKLAAAMSRSNQTLMDAV